MGRRNYTKNTRNWVSDYISVEIDRASESVLAELRWELWFDIYVTRAFNKVTGNIITDPLEIDRAKR